MIYLRQVKFHFDLYKHEIRSFESLHLLLYADSENFISKQYINGVHKSQVTSDVSTGTEAMTDTVNSKHLPSLNSIDDQKQSHVHKKQKSDNDTDISNVTVGSDIVKKIMNITNPVR